jgi:oxysterol-binding protein-related protein 8
VHADRATSQGVSASESAVVWAEVSAAILNKDWEAARQAKRRVEETARRLAKERNERGEVWTPSHFSLWQNKHGDWECWPLEDSVPPAPIVVPSPL